MRSNQKDLGFILLALFLLGGFAFMLTLPIDHTWRQDIGKNLFAYSIELFILIVVVDVLLKRRELHARAVIAQPYARFLLSQVSGCLELLVAFQDALARQDTQQLISQTAKVVRFADKVHSVATASATLQGHSLGERSSLQISRHMAAAGEMNNKLEELAAALENNAPKTVIANAAEELYSPVMAWEKEARELADILENELALESSNA